MDIYEKLEQLKKLLDEGAITHEEYEREKAKLLFPPVSSPGQPAWDLGIDEQAFVGLMHASQFLSSFIVPLIIWLLYKDKSAKVNEAGKEILNFEISYTLYIIVLCITIVGIFIVPVVALAAFVMIIIAIVKVLNGEAWKYPLIIRFLK